MLELGYKVNKLIKTRIDKGQGMSALPACMYIHHLDVWYLRWSEEGIGQIAGHVNKPRHKDGDDKEGKEAQAAARRPSRGQPPAFRTMPALAPTRVGLSGVPSFWARHTVSYGWPSSSPLVLWSMCCLFFTELQIKI